MSGKALVILALLQRIWLMSSQMLLLGWLRFCIVLRKLLPVLGTISGRCFFFSSRRRHTRCGRDWSSDVCSSDLDYRGGGRSSARETAVRVAAGAIARQVLQSQGIQIRAAMVQMGDIVAQHIDWQQVNEDRKSVV